jgi:hypothetical protein
MISLDTKRIIIAGLSFFLLAALLIVGYIEGKKQIPGAKPAIVVSDENKKCIECHSQQSNATTLVAQWKESQHAIKGVGCLECHGAEAGDIDAFDHYKHTIATIVSPKDCSRCHKKEFAEFQRSHHAQGGKILGSLDNVLAEVVAGSVMHGNPVAVSGCKQCHGSVVNFVRDENGNVMKDRNGIVMIDPETWPNTGIGRVNPDGSLGSCAACHNRHYFSVAQAREPDDCGKCHLGPDHPQKEIYDESKHGVAFRDLIDEMNLDARPWVVGKDYSAAPTCATCHMSANLRNGMKITHDPGERISWTNRPPVSLVMDTDASHAVVTETDPERRRAAIADTAEAKRNRMKQVCSTCHTPDHINLFYRQYDDLVVHYNEKFAKPGQAIMSALAANGLLTKTQYDEKIEWTWYYLWHHEGRRARMGASMMAPDYTQWHGMFEVAERFYMELIPEAREITAEAARSGRGEPARRVNQVIDEILARPEHQWLQKGAEEQADAINREMQRRYGQTRQER